MQNKQTKKNPTKNNSFGHREKLISPKLKWSQSWVLQKTLIRSLNPLFGYGVKEYSLLALILLLPDTKNLLDYNVILLKVSRLYCLDSKGGNAIQLQKIVYFL